MVAHQYNKRLNNKGLTNVVALIIVMFILLALLVPFLFYFISSQSYNQVSSAIVNNYNYLKNLQTKKVINGYPSIYYNGSELTFIYINGSFTPPINITITKMLYLSNNGVWEEVQGINYPITVSPGKSINLPSYVVGKPVIIVTSLGNLFFLEPNSSIGPLPVVGSGISKGGVIIYTQIYNNVNNITLVNANITTNIYGKWENFTTPIAFSNQTGTFEVRVPQYVYYENSKGEIITGSFSNWAIVQGKAILNSTKSLGIKVTLEGQPVVLIANYTPLLAKTSLIIYTNFTNVNISIDGRTYIVNNGEVISNIPAGFANITVHTLQGNLTVVSNEIIEHLAYSYMKYQNNIINTTSAIIFLPPTSTQNSITITYKNNYNYYSVCLEAVGNDGLPIQIGNNLYNYGQSYWIIGGNYTFSPVGLFEVTCTYGAVNVIFEYYNGTQFTYIFPNIPGYVIINQPMTICVIYGKELYWTPLPGVS